MLVAAIFVIIVHCFRLYKALKQIKFDAVLIRIGWLSLLGTLLIQASLRVPWLLSNIVFLISRSILILSLCTLKHYIVITYCFGLIFRSSDHRILLLLHLSAYRLSHRLSWHRGPWWHPFTSRFMLSWTCTLTYCGCNSRSLDIPTFFIITGNRFQIDYTLFYMMWLSSTFWSLPTSNNLITLFLSRAWQWTMSSRLWCRYDCFLFDCFPLHRWLFKISLGKTWTFLLSWYILNNFLVFASRWFSIFLTRAFIRIVISISRVFDLWVRFVSDLFK